MMTLTVSSITVNVLLVGGTASILIEDREGGSPNTCRRTPLRTQAQCGSRVSGFVDCIKAGSNYRFKIEFAICYIESFESLSCVIRTKR